MSTNKTQSTAKTIDILSIVQTYLERHNVKDASVDVFELCRMDKIIMLPYSTQKAKDVAEILGIRYLMEETDGFTLQLKKKPVIFWDDSKPIARQKSTIAHELGHQVLGHAGPSKLFPNGYCTNCQFYEEVLADSFAFNLLFPDFHRGACPPFYFFKFPSSSYFKSFIWAIRHSL